MSSKKIARTALAAAVYAAASLITLTVLQGFAWGPIQFRISEAVCVLALFMPEAPLGLMLGCALANLIAIPFTGLGMLAMLDVVFGSIATLLGALWMRRFRKNYALALAGPVFANAIIVPLYLPLLCAAFGFYTIPFTSISVADSYALMYVFGFLSVGIGEAVVMYVLGLPLSKALKKRFAKENFSSR